MSQSAKLPWADAYAIAETLVLDLAPAVARLKVAGSLRRRTAEVGDIEIVAEPRATTSDLFGTPGPDLDAIRAVALGWGRLLRNGPRFIQVERPDGLHIDLFLVHPPAEWGSILAIRTGPAELSKHAVQQLRRRGLVHRDGHIERERGGGRIPTPEEADFFAAAGLPCLPPARRNLPQAFAPVSST